jgi:hypothetical protein
MDEEQKQIGGTVDVSMKIDFRAIAASAVGIIAFGLVVGLMAMNWQVALIGLIIGASMIVVSAIYTPSVPRPREDEGDRRHYRY